jgi:hypothetical protein
MAVSAALLVRMPAAITAAIEVAIFQAEAVLIVLYVFVFVAAQDLPGHACI